jgi:hypothetical protein
MKRLLDDKKNSGLKTNPKSIVALANPSQFYQDADRIMLQPTEAKSFVSHTDA